MADPALAKLMIDEIEQALARGTTHYNRAGQPLTTPAEIIACLLREGFVTFQPSDEK